MAQRCQDGAAGARAGPGQGPERYQSRGKTELADEADKRNLPKTGTAEGVGFEPTMGVTP